MKFPLKREEDYVAGLDEDEADTDLVHYIDGREAALALPDETYVPVDVAVTGYVEQLAVNGKDLADA